MKVYFGAAITSSRNFLSIYRRIVKEINKQGHQVLSEYVVDPKLKIGAGLKPEKLFEREAKTIEKVDLMIAEVTEPSWGTAFLMEHALKHGIPVVALFYKDSKRLVPMMVKGHPQLFLENYDLDNIKSILDDYFHFFKTQKKRKGKLIVIDGPDGSGKATQARLLRQSLKKFGKTVQKISFPRYSTSFHGDIVGRFLKGEFGEMDKVSPYLISLAYALDRLTARKQINDWLEAGDYIVSDRYTSASMAHQTAKVPQKKRNEFLRWLEEMEYQRHKIPREDVVIFLYMPVEVSRRLLAKKGNRRYMKGRKKDIAEINLKHQEESLKIYLKLTKEKKHWIKINCLDQKGSLKSQQEIQKEILETLRRKSIIK